MEQPKNPFLIARILVLGMVQSALILLFMAYSLTAASGTSEIFSQELCYVVASLLCVASFALPHLLCKFLPPHKVSFETVHEAMRFHHMPLIFSLVLADAGVIICFVYTITSGDINPLLGIGVFSIAIMISHLPSEQKIRSIYRIRRI